MAPAQRSKESGKVPGRIRRQLELLNLVVGVLQETGDKVKRGKQPKSNLQRGQLGAFVNDERDQVSNVLVATVRPAQRHYRVCQWMLEYGT